VSDFTISNLKLSREVTNLSKKVIFLLHCLTSEDAEDEQEAFNCAVQQGHPKLAEISLLFQQMSIELEGENFWQYQKTVSPGLQEYIKVLGQNQVQSSYYLKTDIYAPLLNQEKSTKTSINTYNS
jgi:predicted translin family RNA/ssDNA-binding protein